MWLLGTVAIVLAGAGVVIAAMLEHVAAPPVPRTGEVTPDELRRHDLPVRWRGYDVGAVDALLGRAATTLETADHYGREPSDHDRAAATAPWFLNDGADADESGEEDGDESGEELEDGGGDGTGRLDR